MTSQRRFAQLQPLGRDRFGFARRALDDDDGMRSKKECFHAKQEKIADNLRRVSTKIDAAHATSFFAAECRVAASSCLCSAPRAKMHDS